MLLVLHGSTSTVAGNTAINVSDVAHNLSFTQVSHHALVV